MRPHERSGHDVSITVNVDAGVELEALECVSHDVEVELYVEDTERQLVSKTISPCNTCRRI